GFPLPAHLKAVADVSGRSPAVGNTEALDWRIAAPGKHPPDRFRGTVRDDQAVRRQRAHEMMELRLDCREIRKDIGVVELQIVEYRGARRVVQELGALVEERRVVFVSFHHEWREAALFTARIWLPAIANSGGHTEIVRNTPDEEAGGETG